jgi:4-hydroxy-3-methylbut-2-en-1-yl diphosphate reductase
MVVIKADHLGMCFGVKDAIQLAIEQSQSKPLTILGDLVHNETVMSDLRARGIHVQQQVGTLKTESVMITAHGASNKTINHVRDQGFNVTEATCPLVHLAHRAVAKLVDEGFHPVIIGRRDHVEVRGITEDLEDFDVVLTEADAFDLQERAKFGIAAQTTQPIDRVRYLVGLIRWRFPNSKVRFVDTVCQPTKQRQNAAVELAQRCDVVVVVGGADSNNTRELVKTCARHCARVHHVQNVGELREEWFAGARKAGVTAGTSTPDTAIDEVFSWMKRLAKRQIEAEIGAPAETPEVHHA